MSHTVRRRPWRRTCPTCGQDVMVEFNGRILPHLTHGTREQCRESGRRYPASLQARPHTPPPRSGNRR